MSRQTRMKCVLREGGHKQSAGSGGASATTRFSGFKVVRLPHGPLRAISMLLPGNHEEVPSTGRVGTLRSACRSRTHAAPTAKRVLLRTGRNRVGTESPRGGAACPQDALGALGTTRSTSGNSFCKNQHACLTGRRCCFLGVGPRLTNDACDTWCVGPAPFRQAQGPERVEGLVAGLQFIGKTARRQAAALHRTASAQLRPARSFPCIFPNVQRRRRACA
jgi:hypothetical protein